MNFFGNTFFLKILQAVILSISPILISVLSDGMEKLRVAAAESENPWDDILVEFLSNIVDSLDNHRP